MLNKLFLLFTLLFLSAMTSGCDYQSFAKKYMVSADKKYPGICNKLPTRGISNQRVNCIANQAHKHNEPEAQYDLAMYYQNAHSSYYMDSVKWMDKSAAEGYPPAIQHKKNRLAKLRQERKDTDRKEALAQRKAAEDAEAERLALIAKKEHFAKERKQAAIEKEQTTIKRNKQLKLNRERAIAQAKKETDNKIKVCYSKTSGKDIFPSCLHLAKLNHKKAITRVADMYLSGDGVKQNFGKSLYWYEKLAKKDDTYASSQIPIVKEKIKHQKTEAKEKERIRLANTWFEIEGAWKGQIYEPQCKKADKSPADFAKSMGTFGGKVKFVDEATKDGKIMEVTVNFYNFIIKQQQDTRFFRGIERCEAHAASKNRQRKANKVAQERALDKYR